MFVYYIESSMNAFQFLVVFSFFFLILLYACVFVWR